jgi:hypothetical protein
MIPSLPMAKRSGHSHVIAFILTSAAQMLTNSLVSGAGFSLSALF